MTMKQPKRKNWKNDLEAISNFGAKMGVIQAHLSKLGHKVDDSSFALAIFDCRGIRLASMRSQWSRLKQDDVNGIGSKYIATLYHASKICEFISDRFKIEIPLNAFLLPLHDFVPLVERCASLASEADNSSV